MKKRRQDKNKRIPAAIIEIENDQAPESFTPTKSEENICYIGAIIDINEHQNADKALAKLARTSEVLRSLLVSLNLCHSLEEILGPLLDTAIEIADTDAGAIYLVEDHHLILRRYRGIPDQLVSAFSSFPVNDPSFQAVIKSRQTVKVAAAAPQFHDWLLSRNLHDAYSAPLWAGGHLVGVINVASTKGRQMDPGCIQYLDILALEAGSFLKRLRAEEAVHVSEENFRQLFENANEGIFIFQDGNIKFLNESYVRIIGYTREEVSSLELLEILHPKDRETVRQNNDKCLKHLPVPDHYDIRLICKNGEIKWVTVSAVEINWNGRPAVVMFVSDITERVKSEKALHLTQFSLDGAAEATAWFKSDGSYFYVNDATCRMLGYSREELQSMRVADINQAITPENWPKYWQRLRQQNSIRYETIFRRKDGDTIPVEITANYLEYDGQELCCGFAHDISERKRAENELRSKERQLSSIYDNVSIALFFLSVEFPDRYRFLSVNKSFMSATGLTENQVVGKYVDELFPEPSLSLMLGNYRRAIREKRTIRWEETADNPRGRQYSDVNITPIFDDGGRCNFLIGSVNDITEQKKIEQALSVNEKFNRAVIEHSPLGVSVRSKTGKLLSCNSAWQRIWGKTNLQVAQCMAANPAKLQFNYKDSYLGPWLPEVEKIYKEGGYLYVPEAKLYFNNMSGTRWVAQHFYAIKDSNGDVDRVVIMTEDITERKKSEEAILENEQRFRRIFEDGPLGMATADADFCFRGVNSAFCKMLGYSEPELLNMAAREITHPEHLESDLAMETKLLNKEIHCYRTEKRYLRKDGIIFWGSLTVNAIRDKNDRFLYFLALIEDVNERKKAEENLRESEERLNNLVGAAQDAIIMLDPDGNVSMWNESAVRIFGYSTDEIMGQNMYALLAPARCREDYLRSFTEFRLRGENKSTGKVAEFMALRKSGEEFPIELSLSAARIKGQWHAIGIVRDITERKKSQETLLLTKASIDRANDVIFWIRPDASIYFANDAASRVLGYDKDALLSMSVMDIDPCFDKDKWNAHWQEIKVRKAFTIETTHRRKDGAIFPVEVSTNYINYDGAEFSFVFARDITKRKEAKEAVSRLATAVDQVAESIIVTDARGSIEYVNPAFEKITGYSKDEAIGQNPRILKSGKHDSAFYRQIWQTILAGNAWTGNVINRKKDGRLYSEEMTISPVHDSDGNLINFVAVERDVTQEKILEEQLHHSQKMEAVGRLAGGIAHDFNNLLTAINGYAEFILKNLSESDPMRSDAEEIRKAGNRATSLTRQLLAFSRKQVLQPKVLDLNAVINDLNKMLRRLIGEDIELCTSLNSTISAIKADPGQIEQIIMNITVNARDAMPDGGTLKIETDEIIWDTYAAQQVLGRVSGRYILLSISDTGMGMDEDILDRIFEPFFTTKEQGKGTGLGLSTVYGIVKQNGGHIEVSSEPGMGSTFRIYFPSHQENAEDLLRQDDQADSVRGHETILVVEDEEVVRNLACRILKLNGYNVLMAADSAEAIEICRNYRGPIHMILTDVVMPKMNGEELVKYLKPQFPNIKVIYMSGYTDNAVIRSAVLESQTEFINKPFKMDYLSRRVRECLDKDAKSKPDKNESAALPE